MSFEPFRTTLHSAERMIQSSSAHTRPRLESSFAYALRSDTAGDHQPIAPKILAAGWDPSTHLKVRASPPHEHALVD